MKNRPKKQAQSPPLPGHGVGAEPCQGGWFWSGGDLLEWRGDLSFSRTTMVMKSIAIFLQLISYIVLWYYH